MKPGQTQLKDGNPKVAHLHNNKQKEHFFAFALVLFFAHFAVVFVISTTPGNDLFCRRAYTVINKKIACARFPR